MSKQQNKNNANAYQNKAQDVYSQQRQAAQNAKQRAREQYQNKSGDDCRDSQYKWRDAADPQGSWTGVPWGEYEVPVQDADDL